MQTYWLGIHPIAILKNVQIETINGIPAIHIQKIKVKIAVFASLYSRKLIFHTIELQGSKLLIKKVSNNKFSVNGILLPNNQENSSDLEDYIKIHWSIHDIDLQFENLDKDILKINNLTIKHSFFKTVAKADKVEIFSHFLLKPIIFNTFSTNLAIQKKNAEWILHLENILIKNHWLNISGNADLAFSKEPILHLTLNYFINPTGNLLEWLPYDTKDEFTSLRLSGKSVRGELTIRGPLQSFQLQKPFHLLRGNVAIDNISLHSSTSNPLIEELNGELFFNYPIIEPSQFKAKILGEPFHININSLFKNNSHSIIFSLDGKLNTKTLKQIPHLETLEKYAQGHTPLHISGVFAKNLMEPNYSIKLTSNLLGLNIKLLEPFRKTSEESNVFEVELIKKFEKINFLIHYENRFNANLLFEKSIDNQWQVNAGNIYFGNAIANFPNEKGIFIKGKIPRLDILDLIAYFPGEKNDDIPVTSYFPIKSIQLDFDNLLVADYPLYQTKLLTKFYKNQWLIDIKSRAFVGELNIPNDLTKMIDIKLKHFIISSKLLKAIKHQSDDKVKIKPQQVPSFNIQCKSFYYDAHNLGTILLKTKTRNKTVWIENFAIKSSNINLTMKGSWQANNGTEKAILEGHAVTKNFGEFLKEWHISESLMGASGNLAFKLYWPSAIYDLRLSQLNGYLTFSLKDGVILDVIDNKYELLGNILNVFSIDSLEFIFAKPFGLIAPKRPGFDFDVEKVDFIIKNGMLLTDNFYLHGKLAEIEAFGKIDLVHQTYHLNLEITPFLTAYLPMNLALAGGPTMLGIVWASDKLMSGLLNKFFRQYYYVSGPWEKPNYQKLKSAPNRNTNEIVNLESKNILNKNAVYKGYHD